MTRRLAARLLLASALALSWGCEQDGRVLWVGDDIVEDGAGSGMATGDPTLGSELEIPPWRPPPPPPPPVECPGPDGPLCFCPEATSCSCGNPQEPVPELCQLVCDGSHCSMFCHSGNTCDMSCDAGSCFTVCEPFSTCVVTCSGECTVLCQQGSYCSLWSYAGNSHLFCDPGSSCECLAPGSCDCSGPGCPPP